MNLVVKWTEAGFMDDSVPVTEKRQLVYILEESEKFIGGIAGNNSHMLPFSIYPHIVAKLHYERDIWIRESDLDDLLNILYGVANAHGNKTYVEMDEEAQMVIEVVNAYHQYIIENPRGE